MMYHRNVLTEQAGPSWSRAVAIASDNAASQITTASNTYVKAEVDSTATGLKCVPAAVTVRIINSEALQTTTGVVYIGQMHTKEDLRGSTNSWTTTGQQLVSFCKHKGFSAAQLATKSVDVSAVPTDMSELADFEEKRTWSDGLQTYDTQADIVFAGFSPIFIYNPNGINLTLEIMVEWRVRHSSLSIFHSRMQLHQPAPERSWFQAIEEVTERGIHFTENVEKLGEGMSTLYNTGKVIASTVGRVAGFLM
jgi:hypothetical protein